MKIKWFRPDIISIFFALFGVALLILTLEYRINPVEGSVVDPAIRGTSLHWILLVTTMPAWIAGVALTLNASGDNFAVAVVSMFLFQVLLYHFLGKLVSLGVAIIRTRRSNPGKTP
jgi:hypothetical protein